MTHESTTPRRGDWKVLRTALTGLADNDWAEDISDALLADAQTAAIPLNDDRGNKVTGVEFRVIAYVASSGLMVDLAGETFSAEPYFYETPIPAKDGSNVIGRAAASDLAFRGPTSAGLQFNQNYTVSTSGNRRFTLRLHTLSGAPVGADRYEVQWREVTT